jgi:hypothetical protein
LIDKLLIQPERDQEQKAINFRNDLNELANIIAELNRLDWQGNQQLASMQAQPYTPKRTALRNRILALDKEIPGIVGYADRMILVGEFEYFGLYEEALEQLDLALLQATTTFEVANVHGAMARLKGRQSDADAMRHYFAMAVDELKSLGFQQSAILVMQVYIQWVSYELYLGDCNFAALPHAAMQSYFSPPNMWPAQARTELIQQFNQVLATSPTTCELTLG